jgi:protein-S-isoprenylcysteine O-methyltransferase Ste14
VQNDGWRNEEQEGGASPDPDPRRSADGAASYSGGEERRVSRIVRVAAFAAALGGVLFVSAGRLDLPWFWAFLAVHTALLAVQQSNERDDLRRERAHPGPGGYDRYLRAISLPFYAAHLVVAGLDAGRFGWSGSSIPAAGHAAGLVAYACGMGLAMWAMAVNRFFSPVARIQSERGHQTISRGPYRYVRHPGYAGGLIAMLGGGIALGSWWSLLPLVPVAALTLRRTVMEDRMLQSGLEGYATYAEQVPSRLVPGLW